MSGYVFFSFLLALLVCCDRIDVKAASSSWRKWQYSPSLSFLRVCIVDEEHIHPLEAHFILATIAVHVLFNTHWNELPVSAIRDYVDLRWGREISSAKFKSVLLQAGIDLNYLRA